MTKIMWTPDNPTHLLFFPKLLPQKWKHICLERLFFAVAKYMEPKDWNPTVHKASSVRSLLSKFGADELNKE